MSPQRHRHQRQGARQPQHSGADEDAEHVGVRRPPGHAETGGQQHHVAGDTAVQPGQDDAGDAPAALPDPRVRHVRERRDVRHAVGHQHVIPSRQEVELS